MNIVNVVLTAALKIVIFVLRMHYPPFYGDNAFFDSLNFFFLLQYLKWPVEESSTLPYCQSIIQF